MKQAALSLGSNLGDRNKNIQDAVSALRRLPRTKVLLCSSLIETEAVETKSVQPDYLNCCLLLETGFSPEALLGCCLGIEAALGRDRPYDKAPRIIDIDLIFYEGETRDTPELMLPHPRWQDREFVRRPLEEIFAIDNRLSQFARFAR